MTILARPTATAAALAVLWAVLAWTSPGTTYHVAPFAVAAVVPAALLLSDGPGPARSLPAAMVIGGALAMAVTALLGSLGKLAGPSLLPFGGAVTEAAVFAAAAIAVIAAAAVVRHP